MSFDLGIWHEPEPITPAVADEIYGRLCEEQYDGMVASDRIDVFYRELTARFPEIDDVGETDMEKSPWSCALAVSPYSVLMSMTWPSSRSAVPVVVRELAAKHGLACYDPQAETVSNGVGWQPALSTFDDVVLENPDEDTIATEVAALSADRWFLILEARSHWYFQTAVKKEGGYTLEYREGGPENHYETAAATLDEVRESFVAYAAQDDSWKSRFVWQKVTF